MEAEQSHWLCEERYGKVISFKYGKQTERIARFLKPCARSSSEAESIASRAPLLLEVFSSRNKKWPPKVNFKGWMHPQKNWNRWVETLAAQYCAVWNQSGICDAIMSSCFEIRCNTEIVLGLAEFWCPETNTFVFPWGEATITLEDVMIIGGFSVLGEPIMKPVTTSVLEKAVDAMRKRKFAMSRERSKKASQCAWMKHFMENDSEFEHVAFLSLWLSRYVFPLVATETISKDVFPIAAHLSRGTQMALAPAVLAGLYKNLRLLKEQAPASSDEITVFAPFQLVLLWAFEHFPYLVQKPPNKLKPGEPRAARWHKLFFKIDTSTVSDVFISGDSFKWRPYAADISNWNHSSYYRVTKHLLIDSKKNSDKEMQSHALCLQMSHLVGFDCKERYMPHRVAMQFGMDQDLPGEFSGLDFVPENVCFFVPPKSFEPSVSARYFNWWKKSEFICRGTVPNVLRKSSDTFKTLSTKGEMCTKKYYTPSIATSLKNGETISQSFTKHKAKEVQDDKPEFDDLNDSFDISFKSVCQSGFLTREAESLEWSPSIEEVKDGGACYISAESSSSKSPESSTQDSAGVKCHASVTHEFASIERFQESIEADHVAVAGNSKQRSKNSKDIDENPRSAHRQSANAMSRRATSDEIYLNQNTKKRNFSTAMEGTSNFEATISMINDNTEKLQRELDDSTKNLKEVVKEDRKDNTNKCFKTTADVERRNTQIKHGNIPKGSVQDVSEKCKESIAQASFNLAVNVDNNGLRTPTTFEECDLEKRIEKLEKLLGVFPDIG